MRLGSCNVGADRYAKYTGQIRGCSRWSTRNFKESGTLDTPFARIQPCFPGIDRVNVEAVEIPCIPCCNDEVMGPRSSCNQRIAEVQDTPASPCICPKSRGPLSFFVGDGEDAIRIRFYEIRQHGPQIFAPSPLRQQPQAKLQLVQNDG